MQDWHDPESGARGLQVRLSSHVSVALLALLALHDPPEGDDTSQPVNKGTHS